MAAMGILVVFWDLGARRLAGARRVWRSALIDAPAAFGQLVVVAVPVVMVCARGVRAQRAVAVAKKLGYDNAQALSGGLAAWREANLPVEKG